MSVNSVTTNTLSKAVTESTSSTSSNSTKTTRNTGELGKDDFLRLLVTQLQYQDPLNPMDNTEFMGQMAQFSALEQMQNLNATFSSVKAFGLMNKYITATVKDTDSGETKYVSGVVDGVKMRGSTTYVTVGDYDISIDNILSVADKESAVKQDIYNYAGLIGYSVDGQLTDSETGDTVKINGIVKSVKNTDDGTFLVMTGVVAELGDIITSISITDPNYREQYLKNNIGKTINVMIVDRENDKQVPVKAVLKDYTMDEQGNVTASLDDVYVPVENVSSISIY